MYNFVKYIFMKKENLIFAIEMLVMAYLVSFTVMFIRDLDELSLWKAGLFFVAIIIFFTLEFWRERIKDEKNPFSLKKIGVVLSYLTEKRYGFKSEFVELYGEEMYNLFLEKGYIHQQLVQPDGEPDAKWEVTKLGMKRKVEICS